MTCPRTAATGTALAAAGACCYGVTVVVGRRLAEHGVPLATALGTRFAIAAVCLAAVLAVRRVPLRPLPGERVSFLVLGAVGYAAESTLFYLSLQRGTAAACAMLFYTYPAAVLLIEIARRREGATGRTVGALGLSTVGAAVVVAGGGDVAISTTGVSPWRRPPSMPPTWWWGASSAAAATR